MGIFGFACGRCWDKDCNCTTEELKEYEEKCALNRLVPNITEYSKTNPAVCIGDLVLKNNKQYFVREIKEGVAIIEEIINEYVEPITLKEPYQKIVAIGSARELFP